jgi:CRP/FNR family transcriptional regulator
MDDFLNTSCQTCKSRIDTIFKDLSQAEMSQLNTIKTCQFFKKGDVLFNEGAYPRGLFCVHSGKIKITQIGTDGKEQIVHLIHDGNTMGHRAIFGDDIFSCSAVAMEDSHVCFIPKVPFYAMVENNAKLAINIAHLLSDELKEAEHKITHTAQRPVRDRVAESLLILKKNYGFEEDQCTINVTIKREDIANLAGTTRESATRCLYDFQTNQIIELDGKKIKILQLKKLTEIAHLNY